jgi:hypothetical protein
VALKFAFLSRFGMKFVEVGGAGVASALCAYFLGQINQPSAPPPPPPIVQVMPASEDALRMARDENALLAALVRKEADSQAKTESAPATPAAGSAVAAKPAKPAQAEPARRSQKPAQAAQAEPLPIQPPISATASAPAPARPASESLVARDEGDGPLLTRIKQIPSWFLPENDRIFGEVPRPPMPVGELLSLPLKATAMIR